MVLTSTLSSRLRLVTIGTRFFLSPPTRTSNAYSSLAQQQQQSHRRFSELAKSEASSSQIATAESSSSSPSATATSSYSHATSEAAADSFAPLIRHGSGDGVIKLNVGGKEFITLRSTVGINAVLRDHVYRAETNKEFTHGGEAVFIDRDPAQFSLILQHLRNEACGLQDLTHAAAQKACKTTQTTTTTTSDIQSSSSRTGSSSLNKSWNRWKTSSTLIQIPDDKAKMRELFVEARHYQIKELEDILCKRDFFIRLSSLFGSTKSNPFQETTQLLNNLRRAFLATSGVGIFVGRESLSDLITDAKDFLVFGKVSSRNNVSSETTKGSPPASSEPSLA